MVNTRVSKSPSTPNQDNNKSGSNNNKEKTTSGKKMKQTRLPFAQRPSAKGDSVVRKRKLSSPEEVREVKIVRHDPDEPVVIEDEEEVMEDVIEEGEEMVEIIPLDESNSAHPLEESISEETTDQVEIVQEDGEDSKPEATTTEEAEEPDQLNESITNLDGQSSESTSGDDAEKTATDSIVDLLEPPINPNGKPLTPRQLEKFMDKKKRHEERLRQKVEREKKLEDERRQKEERERQKKKEREEKEEQKRKEREEKEEQKRKEKEEKEVQRAKEKEDRERKKQEELDLKRQRDEQKKEEKRKRDEQMEEERRKKEEEKRKKELEEELKKKRASQAFTKFFKMGPKTEEESPATADAPKAAEEMTHQYFMPFEVKGDMKLAPTVRRPFPGNAKSTLDEHLKKTVEPGFCYLKLLKTKKHVPLKGAKTYSSSDSTDSEDDLMVVDDELAHKVQEIKPKQKYRAKFLMFHENRRPAYYGTWQKKSTTVGPRTPFGKDEKYFDYEVDSDDEWEEEEPGESLHGSGDEKDKESEDDYEVDNDFFVPHGHLSDEEMQNVDEEEDNSPEAQKVKLKLLQDEFNDEMKKKTEKIKPRLIGCIWVNAEGGKPENCPDVFWELLQFRTIIAAGPIVLRAPEPEAEDEGLADAEDDEKPTNGRKGNSLPEDEIRDLITLVHGNLNRSKFLVQEFQAYREKQQPDPDHRRIVTNLSILRKIKELAKWESNCWNVQKEFLEKYDLLDLPLVNDWQYLLTPKRTHLLLKSEKKAVPASPQVATVDPSATIVPVADIPAPKTPTSKPQEKSSPSSAKQSAKSNQNSIARFAKVLTTEEKQRQFQSIQISSPKPSTLIPNENKAPGADGKERKPVDVIKSAEPLTGSAGGVVQPAAATTGVKKRVPLLMSVPRGQAISEQSKNLLIKNFLNKQPEKDVVVGTGAVGSPLGGEPRKEAAAPVATIVLD